MVGPCWNRGKHLISQQCYFNFNYDNCLIKRFEKEPKDKFQQFSEAIELDETELKDKVHNCGGYWQWVVLISIIDSNITDILCVIFWEKTH